MELFLHAKFKIFYQYNDFVNYFYKCSIFEGKMPMSVFQNVLEMDLSHPSRSYCSKYRQVEDNWSVVIEHQRT